MAARRAPGGARLGHYRRSGTTGCVPAGLYFVNTPAPPELDHLRSDAGRAICRYSIRASASTRSLLRRFHTPTRFARWLPSPHVMLWPGYLRHCTRVHLAARRGCGSRCPRAGRVDRGLGRDERRGCRATMAFNGLWPTMLVSRRLPGYERPLRLGRAHRRTGGARGRLHRAVPGADFFSTTTHTGGWRWLKDQIDQNRHAFLRQRGIEGPCPGRSSAGTASTVRRPSRATYAPEVLPERHVLRRVPRPGERRMIPGHGRLHLLL